MCDDLKKKIRFAVNIFPINGIKQMFQIIVISLNVFLIKLFKCID